MVNWFSEITFACLRDLKVMIKKNDLSAILTAILNLNNYYEQESKNCGGNTFSTNRLVII